MRIVRPASEDEVLVVFVRGELDSSRYGEPLRELLRRDGRDEAALDDPGYARTLLALYRGWPDEGLFAAFPTTVAWQLTMFGREELLRIRYISWDWWLTLSDGSRSPVTAAERIRERLVPGVDAESHEPLAVEAASAPPLIVATTPTYELMVVIEGHYRLTARCTRSTSPPSSRSTSARARASPPGRSSDVPLGRGVVPGTMTRPKETNAGRLPDKPAWQEARHTSRRAVAWCQAR